MDRVFRANNGARTSPGWLALVMLLWGAGPALPQTPGARIMLDSAHVVAGESKPIQFPIQDNQISSIVSVSSSPHLPFPIRVDLGPLRFTVPPATPPGEYQMEITARADDGRMLNASLHVTVSAVSVAQSPTGRPPVILLNGFDLLCIVTGSTVADSTGTFGQMAALLEAESVPVLFFNNCAYGDYNIETFAGLLNSYIAGLTYTNGTPVTQVDLVAHSMGGLIVRAYLAGIQPGDGSFIPPANPRVRKAVFIATPHFGSFQAGYIGVQESEMVLGGPLLWDLATWNQRHDDLRGVDAVAIIGNAGSHYPGGGLDDGVVSLTSASLGFAEPDQNTRVVQYCHTDPGLNVFGIGMECFAPYTGIADIGSSSHLTWQIVDSFLAGTTAWTTIGHPPSQDAYLSQDGGLVVEETSAAGSQVNLTGGLFGTSFPLLNSLSSDGLVYTEFGKGTASFTSGALSCGPFTLPAGYYSATRGKFSPLISAVGPLLQNVSGVIVQSGSTITISGAGFGQAGCSTCQVLAYPGPVALQVTSWVDTTITAFLPSSYNSFAQILVQNAAGEDYINIMASPAPASLTIQTNPSGLQFNIDGGSFQTAPQTFSLVTGSTHSVTVATLQPGAPGTQYVFTGWSDGGAASHSFTVNASGTLTASFVTQYQLTLSVSPVGGGTITPASGAFYSSGAAVPISATANSGYSFSDWTGTVANASATSTTVTMSSPLAVTANFKAAITPATPTINSGGVVAVDSTVTTIQPGEWVSIYGTNLASSTMTWTGNFPTLLGGTSVTIDGIPAYLSYVSPEQINLQAPNDPTTGPVSVVVTTALGNASSTVTLAAFAPSFLLFDSKHVTGIILRPDGSGSQGTGSNSYDFLGPTGNSLGFPTVAAKAGDTVELYAGGLGPTNPSVQAGQAFSGAAPTINPVNLLINNVSVTPGFAGFSSSLLYQINLTVPAGLGTGDVSLVATVGGVQTQSGVYVTLQ